MFCVVLNGFVVHKEIPSCLTYAMGIPLGIEAVIPSKTPIELSLGHTIIVHKRNDVMPLIITKLCLCDFVGADI